MRSLVLLLASLTGCAVLPLDPQWVRDRTPLPLCGEIEEEAIGTDREHAAAGCMIAAWQRGAGGEHISRSRTSLGFPMTSYVRVHPNGVIEMFLDLRADRPGDEMWERFRCETLTAVERGTAYVLDGCEQLPLP